MKNNIYQLSSAYIAQRKEKVNFATTLNKPQCMSMLTFINNLLDLTATYFEVITLQVPRYFRF